LLSERCPRAPTRRPDPSCVRWPPTGLAAVGQAIVFRRLSSGSLASAGVCSERMWQGGSPALQLQCVIEYTT
jgi:hypothetical protein